MNSINPIEVSFLVLDFRKEAETRNCLESIRRSVKIPYKTVYLDNGAWDSEYPNQLYREELCDVIIRKKNGMGGGYGQTDLIRFCDTPYFIFVQNDQELMCDITPHIFKYMKDALSMGFHCVDLNGDQSRRGVWTDRAHFMKTDVFNGLAPFPNGGPGLDNVKWNEQYLQEEFANRKYQIFHPGFGVFADCGKWSVREAGDGLYEHRCDTKILNILKQPTYKTATYPPFTDAEWELVLAGKWENGTIPENWKKHSFKFWSN